MPHPAMVAFDAADRSACVVKRQATSTPLQALALLNDTQYVEAARFIAVRMLREGGPTALEQARFAFRLVTGRSPRERELAVLAQALEEQRTLFATESQAAESLLAVGEAGTESTTERENLAAATVVASLLLKHDEAVIRR